MTHYLMFMFSVNNDVDRLELTEEGMYTKRIQTQLKHKYLR